MCSGGLPTPAARGANVDGRRGRSSPDRGAATIAGGRGRGRGKPPARAPHVPLAAPAARRPGPRTPRTSCGARCPPPPARAPHVPLAAPADRPRAPRCACCARCTRRVPHAALAALAAAPHAASAASAAPTARCPPPAARRPPPAACCPLSPRIARTSRGARCPTFGASCPLPAACRSRPSHLPTANRRPPDARPPLPPAHLLGPARTAVTADFVGRHSSARPRTEQQGRAAHCAPRSDAQRRAGRTLAGPTPPPPVARCPPHATSIIGVGHAAPPFPDTPAVTAPTLPDHSSP